MKYEKLIFFSQKNGQHKINPAKYIKRDNLQIGDIVLIGNVNRKKTNPPLQSEPFVVKDITAMY